MRRKTERRIGIAFLALVALWAITVSPSFGETRSKRELRAPRSAPETKDVRGNAFGSRDHALSVFQKVLDSVSVTTASAEQAASPFEPPGKPPDRPPDRGGQPPDPPGRPPDRPPDHSNANVPPG